MSEIKAEVTATENEYTVTIGDTTVTASNLENAWDDAMAIEACSYAKEDVALATERLALAADLGAEPEANVIDVYKAIVFGGWQPQVDDFWIHDDEHLQPRITFQRDKPVIINVYNSFTRDRISVSLIDNEKIDVHIVSGYTFESANIPLEDPGSLSLRELAVVGGVVRQFAAPKEDDPISSEN